ncbi:hypothetical protein SASPL_143878 [Salvia splendens]|uniref:Uncharacterized protein n=1 Tax=Salvia splendens TaxID=180675 RepID=A0A8X8ZAQ9_SALSN|nr:hypothetical protein SASPL_143878 [Salvia splendens]
MPRLAREGKRNSVAVLPRCVIALYAADVSNFIPDTDWRSGNREVAGPADVEDLVEEEAEQRESRIPCNSSKHSREGPIAAVQVAKNQPKIPPTPNNITAAAVAVISPYPSAAMASKNPPDEVLFPKLSVASNGQPPKQPEVSILGETTSEYGLKVPAVFKDPYMGIVPVSAPSYLPCPHCLYSNSSGHLMIRRNDR